MGLKEWVEHKKYQVRRKVQDVQAWQAMKHDEQVEKEKWQAEKADKQMKELKTREGYRKRINAPREYQQKRQSASYGSFGSAGMNMLGGGSSNLIGGDLFNPPVRRHVSSPRRRVRVVYETAERGRNGQQVRYYHRVRSKPRKKKEQSSGIPAFWGLG